MKKIIALLAVFILCFNLSYTQPVRADTFSIPFSAVPDLINAFYTIAAGGKIEFSALIGDMTGINDFWHNLQEYYDTNYTQPLLQSTQGLIDIGLSGLALDGINSIDATNNLTIPITPQDIANFMGYDVNWADRYALTDAITVNPDPQFETFIDRINGSGFWFKDYPNKNNDNNSIEGLVNYPPSSTSWVASNSSVNFNGNSDYYYVVTTDILSLDITSSAGTYSFNCTISNSDVLKNFVLPWSPYSGKPNGYIRRSNNMFGISNTSDTANTINFSISGSLGEVLNYISIYFRNINIYVDNELWAYAGTIPSPGISLNDYTQVGNTDNITYGVFPLTSTGDIGLDLAKWGEYIYNQCISGDGTLTMDTVIDDGWDLVDTDDGERAITTDDEEDVAKVIHGFVGTTATTPTPTPDIGDPPVLKIIPPILELPDEIWPDGGRDTTVLAQIIHSTDVIMPNDIMTILWSILGILVIGGLLTILHK